MKLRMLSALLLLSLSLVACSSGGSGSTAQDSSGQTSAPAPTVPENAVAIALNGEELTLSDATIGQVASHTLTITKAGTYFLYGQSSDYQIVVSAPENENVTLILGGLSLKSTKGAPIFVQSCKNCYLTLDDGSENTLADPASYADTTSEVNATIYAKTDLIITGTGALTVKASYHNGISSKDDLVVQSGNLTITAQNNALKGKDSVTVKGGNLTVDAKGDAIKSDEETKEDKGFVLIQGGTLVLNAADEGIQAYRTVTIQGGDVTLTARSNGIKAEEAIALSGGSVKITCTKDAADAPVVSGSAIVNGSTVTYS